MPTEDGDIGGGGGNSTGSVAFVPDVTNDGQNSIFVKQGPGELRDEIVEVRPGSTWKGHQDGIADPCGHPGEVFKNVDFINVTFTNGEAQTSLESGLTVKQAVESKLGQLLIGAWQDKAFVKAHSDWNALFDYANKRPEGGCK